MYVCTAYYMYLCMWVRSIDRGVGDLNERTREGGVMYVRGMCDYAGTDWHAGCTRDGFCKDFYCTGGLIGLVDWMIGWRYCCIMIEPRPSMDVCMCGDRQL